MKLGKKRVPKSVREDVDLDIIPGVTFTRKLRLTKRRKEMIKIALTLQAEGIRDIQAIFNAGAAAGFGREEWCEFMRCWSDYGKGYGWAKWKMDTA